jgi:DNA-binding NtrC family response regulator
VPILLPPLRERKEDIFLLFRKFAADFAVKYRMPTIKILPDAEQLLSNYYWQGNIRQLKNIAEQISIIEKTRDINANTLAKYLPQQTTLPGVIKAENGAQDYSERDLLYKVLFEMKKDLHDLKKVVLDIVEYNSGSISNLPHEDIQIINRLHEEALPVKSTNQAIVTYQPVNTPVKQETIVKPIVVEESLSLLDQEKAMIIKALDKHKGKRKYAAEELGISERTLYRKINEYGIEE